MTAVVFEWNNGAVEKVQLAGSFTKWEPVDMAKTLGTDKWALKLDLPPGEYEFKFVVDGNWVHDEGQPSKTSSNEMGTLNNVINVAAASNRDLEATVAASKTVRVPPTTLTESTTPSASGSSKSPSSLSSSIEVIEENDESWDIIEDSNANNITPTIEVERKFMVPDNYKEILLKNGFELRQEFDEVLVDTYFDSHEHHLIKVDHWLRKRNGDWELKYPVGTTEHRGNTSIYHETTDLEDVLQLLKPILNSEDESLSEMVNKKLLEPFAHLETKRKNYHKEDINIVIDATDWGHIVGEIEVMVCADKGKISEATKRIEDLGKELDFSPMDLNVLYHKICK